MRTQTGRRIAKAGSHAASRALELETMAPPTTPAAAVPSSKATAERAREDEIARRVLRHWHEALPNDRMAHLVKDTMRAFDRSLRARLARHEVQMGHWTFLRILWDRDGLTKRELSIEAGVAEPTTIIALRAMEALGYVTLGQRPDNRKNVYVFLTERGRQLQQLLVPLAEEVNAIALQGLAGADVAAARRALLTMLDNLWRDPELGESGA